MTKKIKKIIFFLGIIFAFLLKASFVIALEIKYPPIFGGLNDTSSFTDLICYILNLATSLAAFITVIAIASGGIYYLVSYGRGKFTNEGKDMVKAGILGFLIVICASLIIYTINPNLNTCKSGILPFNIFNPFGGTNGPPGVDVITYQEIPIGTLTETLLTRTMDCYGFDENGDPIDGNPETPDILEPTYTNHDRQDCLVKLIDGAQKKAHVIANLSQKITKSMNTCSCREKDADGNDTNISKCDPDSSCGSCPCSPPSPPSCSQPDGTNDCCPDELLDKIEHGIITASPVCQ